MVSKPYHSTGRQTRDRNFILPDLRCRSFNNFEEFRHGHYEAFTRTVQRCCCLSQRNSGVLTRNLARKCLRENVTKRFRRDKLHWRSKLIESRFSEEFQKTKLLKWAVIAFFRVSPWILRNCPSIRRKETRDVAIHCLPTGQFTPLREEMPS